jgi:UPF0716 protein FxsA
MKLALALFFVGYPLAELVLMLQVASWLGALPAIALILLGAVVGFGLLRGQRLSVLARLRRGFPVAGQPLPELLDGALRAAAALLLILPGFISDAVALVLLLPAIRRRLARRMAFAGRRSGAPIVIDGQFRRIDDPALAEAGQKTECC